MSKELVDVVGVIFFIVLMVVVIVLAVIGSLAMYLENVRPYLLKMREEKNRQSKGKITGLSFFVDVERESAVKDEFSQSQYRHRA